MRRTAKLKLFPDQAEVKERGYESLRSNQATLLQCPTGFGKSALATDFCLDAVKYGKTVTVNVPRRELAKQFSGTLRRYGIDYGFIANGMKANPFAPVQISLTDSLNNRIEKVYKTDLLITDECHVGKDSLTNVINTWKQAGRKIIGLSATPRRMDGMGMDTWFDDMVCGPQISWLIENKRLNKYNLVVSDEAIKQAVAAGGSEEEVDRVMFGDAAETYKEHAFGLRALAFCRTIKHATDVAAHFTSNGIPSAAISSKTKDADMLRIIIEFANRQVLVLCNVMVASFGWDLAQLSGIEASVECVIMLRFSDSLPLYMQIAGRFLRVGENVSVFIDHMGVIFHHGKPCDDRFWTLEGELKGTGEAKERLIPTRQCPIEEGGCGMVHPPSPACPRCGRVYPVRDLTIEQVDSAMVMLTPEEFAAAAKGVRKIQGRTDTYEDMVKLMLTKQSGTPNRRKAMAAAGKVLEGRGAKVARGKWYAFAIGGECEWSIGMAKTWCRLNGVTSAMGAKIVKKYGCICVEGVCTWPRVAR